MPDLATEPYDADDYWGKAVNLMTGFPMPARSTLFDSLTSADGIPLFHTEIEEYNLNYGSESTLSPVRQEDIGWQVGTGFDYSLVYYSQSPIRAWRARIVFIGVGLTNGTADLLDPGQIAVGSEFTGGAGTEWDIGPLNNYMGGPKVALDALLNNTGPHPYSTRDVAFNGGSIADASAVDLMSFERTAQAFDRAAAFFAQHDQTLAQWEESLGAEQAAWKGQAAGVFHNLIQLTHRNYTGYAEQTGGTGYTGSHGLLGGYRPTSTYGDAVAAAQEQLVLNAGTLQTAWQNWAATGWHSPQRVLLDILDMVASYFIANNLQKVQISSDGDVVFEPGFTEAHPLLGTTRDSSFWVNLGNEAVRTWNQTVEQYLVQPATQALAGLNNGWIDAGTPFATPVTSVNTQTLSTGYAAELSELSADSLNDTLTGLGDGFTDGLTGLSDGLTDGLTGLGDGLTDGLTGLSDGLNDSLTGLDEGFGDLSSGLGDALGTGDAGTVDINSGLTDPLTATSAGGEIGALDALTDPDAGLTDPNAGLTDPGATSTDPGGALTDITDALADPGAGATDPGGTVTDLNTALADPGGLDTTDPGLLGTTDPGATDGAIAAPTDLNTLLGTPATPLPGATDLTGTDPGATGALTDLNGALGEPVTTDAGATAPLPSLLSPALGPVSPTSPGTTTDDDKAAVPTLINPDGSTTTLNDDGTLTITSPDGTTTEIDPATGLATTTPTDGAPTYTDLNSDLLTNPGGSITALNPDGTLTTTDPDGTVTVFDPDTGLSTVTDPDGTATITDLNNGLSTELGTGSAVSTIDEDDALATLFPDGSETVFDPDTGLATTTDPSGTTTVTDLNTDLLTNPDGSITGLNPDGTLTTTDPDGTVTVFDP
ncbi:AAWKG family protein, partial [Streptomyces sp. NPDC056734]